MNRYIRALLFFGLFLDGTGFAQPAPNNYADDKSWLCRPGRSDVCEADLTTTIILENGNLTRERWNADPNAPIDCFYVYPTVSTDLTPNSDMVADPAELNVIRQQFARFASKCRPYAPMYRQVTLAGLRILLGRGNAGAALSRDLGYDDIRDAWKHYLEHDNNGRGFVLIGHSQGSFVLSELIRNEIDGKPIQSRMVSAILLGTTLSVPRGKRYRWFIPACASVPLRISDRMRHYLRIVPLNHPSAPQHIVRQSERSRYGRRVHQSGSASRRERKSQPLLLHGGAHNHRNNDDQTMG